MRSDLDACAGRAGEECKAADGRELWVLSEMYEVDGVQRWLLEECVDESTLCAAYEFGLVPEGDRRGLVDACEALAKRGLGGVKERDLCGVGGEAVRGLVSCRVNAGGKYRMRDGFHFVERWYLGNGGSEGVSREEVVCVLRWLTCRRCP